MDAEGNAPYRTANAGDAWSTHWELDVWKGHALHPGVAEGPVRFFTAHELFELHQSRVQEPLDRELRDVLNGLLSEKLAEPLDLNEKGPIIEVTFWGAVNEVLENRGCGILYAIASTVSLYLRSAIFAHDPAVQVQCRSVATFGERVLCRIEELRGAQKKAEPGYLAVAEGMSLAEAVCLGPAVRGLAVGFGVDAKLRVAARVLGVPAVSGLSDIQPLARPGLRARLDGGTGMLSLVETAGDGRSD